MPTSPSSPKSLIDLVVLLVKSSISSMLVRFGYFSINHAFLRYLFWRLLPDHIDLLSSSKASPRQWWRYAMSKVLKVLKGFKYYQWQVLKGFKYYQWQISFGSRRNAAMQAPLLLGREDTEPLLEF